MSDTLLRRIYDNYNADLEVMKRNKEAFDEICMIDRIRLLMNKDVSGNFTWWRMDSCDLANLIICGILDDSTFLSAEMFSGMTNITQTTDDNEFCVEFHFYGYNLTGGIHITLLEDKIYVIYDVTYKDTEYSTMWSISYDVILEDKGLS